MDLTKLQGVSNNMKLSPEEKHLRRSIYITFANANALEKLYADVLARFNEYIGTSLLQQKYDEDILYSFFKSTECAPTMEEQEIKINAINIEVYLRPLLPAVNIAPSLKTSSRQTLTKINKIGYQHLHTLSAETELSNTDDTSDSDSDLDDCAPLKKKLKTCRKAIEVNCASMLELHFKNSTRITGRTVHVDVLIFMDEKFSKQLADYLGLIYVEEALKEAVEGDVNDVVFRLDLNNTTASLYRLMQSYINRHLMNGCNNVCIVNRLSLWENFNANVRAVISTETNNRNVCFMEAVHSSNFHVNLGERSNNISVLDYVESIAVVVNKALNFKSHVVAKYKCEENCCYRNVKLPLISIIPLYVLRYFRHCRIMEENIELD